MPVTLDPLLTKSETTVLHAAASALDFEDGARTAGAVARAVKVNQQATPGPATQAVLDKVQTALLANPVFQAIAYPRHFAALMVTRTEGGGHYGPHVDNALIAGVRADLSVTLFLSDPARYDGGALVISDRIEDRAFKLPQGAAVVYPSNTLHHVEPVTKGSRLVVVGWVQSWVQDPAQREILFDLWQAIQSTQDPDQARLLSKSRSNLIRMWAH
ncbi:Fe2+-dependent dioxygenase [Pararhodobacter sp.]|uniref:Fe2+-dependent dioxygenase n=1 Tax=Pararhodobacter sp. TaxID=2127056 RepID=UPI002AFE39F8|nr:Fe2+-dependent dioxygenase [Pararhodobacter sp.]